jgi:hypothetical protein
MTPKEKAKQLIISYSRNKDLQFALNDFLAKQCALIAVDELIKESCKYSLFKNADYQESRIAFFTEVKREIEKR